MMVRMDGNTSMLMSRLKKLEIWDCNSLKSFPRGKLPIALKYLRIADCKELGSLPDADGDSDSNLYLEIRNVPCLYSSEGCHQLPTFVKKFTVDDGGEWLESLLERMLQHSTELQSINISNCETLKTLPILDRVSSVVELYIYNCKVLEYLPEELGLHTPNLKYLGIRRCENFKSLPNTMSQLKPLQRLWMKDCPGIKFIPDGGLPPNLTYLELEHCKNLKALPNTMDQLKSLQRLCMEDCPGIESIPYRGLPPYLTDLQLKECKSLKLVPNTMYQLTSLQILTIPGGALTMGFRQNLQNLMSLQDLRIEQTLPEDIVLPSSLTSLRIYRPKNLKSIPSGFFGKLNSLKDLEMVDCLKLESLPEDGYPLSLGQITITMCPLLKRQRFEENGDYYNLTCNIPYIMTNNVQVDNYS